MILRDCRFLIELHQIHIVQMLKRYVNRATTRISKCKMINFDDYANENKTENSLKYPYISDHP